MPNWLTPLLKWGGIALAVIFAIALIVARPTEPVAGAAEVEGGAPIALYWVLLVIGLVAAVAGFWMGRR
ncbi:MAG: hypothetical protein ACE5Q3_16160 [Alphaproteobacteria bacterium]